MQATVSVAEEVRTFSPDYFLVCVSEIAEFYCRESEWKVAERKDNKERGSNRG